MLFSKTVSATLLSVMALMSGARAFDADGKDNMVLYWGQNSAGTQESLATYCQSDAADIVVLSFISSFPGTNGIPVLNFANACSDTFSSGLLKCDTIAKDIKTCQSLGKKVLLSLGGASGDYSLSSTTVANDFAATLWNMFGEGSADERPFGDAVVDGFDFDIENNNPAGYAALAIKLRSDYFTQGSKTYYLSAGPQCVYPDASVGDLLEKAEIDFAFVQFYNNYCSVKGEFNWDTWVNYAENVSPNKNIKLFLGLPGSTTAAGSGYIGIDQISSTVKSIAPDDQFGGVMLWDASQAFSNVLSSGETFAQSIKDVLNALDVASSSSTVEKSTTTSTKVTTTLASSTKESTMLKSSTTISQGVSVVSGSVSSAPSSTTPTTTTTATPVQIVSVVSASSALSSTAQTTTAQTTSSQTTTAQTTSSQTTTAQTTTAQTTTAQTTSSQTTTAQTTTLTQTTQQTVFQSTVTSADILPPFKGASSGNPSDYIITGTSTSETTTQQTTTQQTTTQQTTTQQTTTQQSTTQHAATQETTSVNTRTTLTTSTVDPNIQTSTTSSTRAGVVTTDTHITTTTTTTPTQPPAQTTTTLASTTSSTTTSSSTDCSTLKGSAQASCLNTNFANGLFSGVLHGCTNGAPGCTSDGKFAICNWGEWVVLGCAAGTTCYASNEGDSVQVGCNWPR